MLETKRLELQTILEGVLGQRHVYFQPPESVKIKYPAIVYSRDRLWEKRANNNLFLRKSVFTLLLIDEDPDSQYIEKLLELPYTSLQRQYVSDNLYHFVIQIFY